MHKPSDMLLSAASKCIFCWRARRYRMITNTHATRQTTAAASKRQSCCATKSVMAPNMSVANRSLAGKGYAPNLLFWR